MFLRSLLRIAVILLAAVFSQTLVAEPVSKSAPSAFRTIFPEIAPQLSVVQNVDLALNSSTQQFSYPRDGVGFLLPQINVIYPLTTWRELDISLGGRLGYAQRTVSASLRGGDPEAFRLHWIPVSVYARLTHPIPGISFLRPTLSTGLGTQVFHQTGREGITAWVPFVFVSPALVFLEATAPDDWWGGFIFGTTISQDLSPNQTANSISFDLSITLLL